MTLETNWKNRTLKAIEVIFRDVFLDDSIKLSETTSPDDIDEWDSMAHVTLLSSIEQEFGVRFTAEEMGSIQNVATLLQVLNERGARAS